MELSGGEDFESRGAPGGGGRVRARAREGGRVWQQQRAAPAPRLLAPLPRPGKVGSGGARVCGWEPLRLGAQLGVSPLPPAAPGIVSPLAAPLSRGLAAPRRGSGDAVCAPRSLPNKRGGCGAGGFGAAAAGRTGTRGRRRKRAIGWEPRAAASPLPRPGSKVPGRAGGSSLPARGGRRSSQQRRRRALAVPVPEQYRSAGEGARGFAFSRRSPSESRRRLASRTFSSRAPSWGLRREVGGRSAADTPLPRERGGTEDPAGWLAGRLRALRGRGVVGQAGLGAARCSSGRRRRRKVAAGLIISRVRAVVLPSTRICPIVARREAQIWGEGAGPAPSAPSFSEVVLDNRLLVASLGKDQLISLSLSPPPFSG